VATTIREMTTKERLHRLVDELSEAEAERALVLIGDEREDPVIAAFRDAPEDDESFTAEDDKALAESREELTTGVPTIPFEEIKRKYGLA
jgi:hypothetical protein